MKYLGQSDYQHVTVPRIGVLLTNLGTPEAPTAKALRPYLKQFLWDPRVVEVPRPIWWLILNGIILNTRPKRSAEAYSAVWNERGSPLLAHLEVALSNVALQAAPHVTVDGGTAACGSRARGALLRALEGAKAHQLAVAHPARLHLELALPQPAVRYECARARAV